MADKQREVRQGLNPFFPGWATGEGLQRTPLAPTSPLSLVQFDLGGFRAVCVTDSVLTRPLPGETTCLLKQEQEEIVFYLMCISVLPAYMCRVVSLDLVCACWGPWEE